MYFRYQRFHWYDLIFLGLAAMMVYPDKVLEWLGEQTGRELGWKHLIWIEGVAILGMVVAMVLLMPHYPRLEWWIPVVYVGFLSLFRFVMALVISFFGFDD